MSDSALEIIKMQGKDLNALLSLQAEIVQSLKKSGKDRFIVPRTTSYFQTHLNTPHQIIGLRKNDKHLGQAIFRCPVSFNVMELGLKILPDYSDTDRVTILQGLIIHPDLAGQGCATLLFKAWLDFAKDRQIKHLTARTESSHKQSQKLFIKHGFEIIDEITDLYDGARVCVLHRVLK